MHRELHMILKRQEGILMMLALSWWKSSNVKPRGSKYRFFKDSGPISNFGYSLWDQVLGPSGKETNSSILVRVWARGLEGPTVG